jgi:parallel beta-helix repeat protein
VDQQTAGYIGGEASFPVFEAARSHWYQIPGAIQVSAARNIHFKGGSYTQLGAGGFGIGNDPPSHITGVGYGAKNVSILEGYFTQVMAGPIVAGGIRIPGHHPDDERLITSHVVIKENIFYNTSSLFSSTAAIWLPYIQYSTVEYNDIYHVPYSGICHNYGWGMNDAGGNPRYEEWGVYDYQPKFMTPTTSQNNVIKGNLIHDYGYSHTDLGAIYLLSKSPDTYVLGNYAENSTYHGIYTDEGANSIIIKNNAMMSQGGHGYGWYNPNQGSGTRLFPFMRTGNNTLIDNLGVYRSGRDFTFAPDGTGILNNTFHRNFVVNQVQDANMAGLRVSYRAGIPPGLRGTRPVSNIPTMSDAGVQLRFLHGGAGDFAVDVWNFDDAPLDDVSFEFNNTGITVEAVDAAKSIPADNHKSSTWRIVSSNCPPPPISVTVSYVNSRTKVSNKITVSGTTPGNGKASIPKPWLFSSTWTAAAGEVCNGYLGIRTGGREINATYDDWGVLYQSQVIGKKGSISADVLSIDGVDPNAKAGVVIRDSFETSTPANDALHVNATGYAAVFATYDGRIVFAWDGIGNGSLTSSTQVRSTATAKLPIRVRLDVHGNTFLAFYAAGTSRVWKSLGAETIALRSASVADAGLITTSRGGFREGTAIFGSPEINKG